MKEFKDLHKWRDIFYSWIRGPNIVKIPILPWLLSMFDATHNLITCQANIFCRYKQNYSKIHVQV